MALQPFTPIDLVRIRSKIERGGPDGWDFYHFWLPVGVELRRQLGFMARAVTIDNMTTRYMYVQNVGRWIPPMTWGATILLTGTQVARLEWIAPPGVPMPPIVAGQFAYALFRSDRPQAVGVQAPSERPIVPLTPAAATFATVGAASAIVVPANADRTGLILVNTHATQRISLSLNGGAAVLDSGPTLMGNGGAYNMLERSFTKNEVRAIASGAGTNLAIQEFS